ncbi:MAG TPA: DNA alkylation repair protein [Sphingomonas sanguinis]|uniref:DNA alkylation repair protein n=1 Tax=Sphingomonas sanguinis TaxID=33051 RepID=UPI002ABF62D1|nr:DNA alkylation repair protein [Sphingomonas sanguinis]
MNEPAAHPLMKDILGPTALRVIADAGMAASPLFDRAAFLDTATQGLDALSVMARVRHIADALHGALPGDYPHALAVLRAMGPRLTHGFQGFALAEYVARYGLHDVDASMEALADLTRHGSAEFAIRPFLAHDSARVLAQMRAWAEHPNEHVRRLASEGARPRLPWGSRVPALKDDPTLAAPILERLKADPSLYVRKSVANHLNDIGKDRPDWLVERMAGWSRDDPRTAWIIRHALRSRIKQGDPAALAIVGARADVAVTVTDFAITPASIRLGETIAITAALNSNAESEQRLVVDYRVHYARANGRTAAKVFKWKSFDLAAGACVSLATRQVIRDFSTRRHHPGRHEIELLVNGRVMAAAGFDLRAA